MRRGVGVRIGALWRLDVELGFVEAHAIAGQQRLLLFQTLTVEKGAVRRAEILDHETARLQPQTRVASGDVTLLDAEIGLLAATDDHITGYDERLIPALTDQMPALAFRHPQPRTADAERRQIARNGCACGVPTNGRSVSDASGNHRQPEHHE